MTENYVELYIDEKGKTSMWQIVERVGYQWCTQTRDEGWLDSIKVKLIGLKNYFNKM